MSGHKPAFAAFLRPARIHIEAAKALRLGTLVMVIGPRPWGASLHLLARGTVLEVHGTLR